MPDDLIKIGKDWFAARGWTPFQFQIETWEAYLKWKKRIGECSYRQWENIFPDGTRAA